MEITDDLKDLATVTRLQEMLSDLPETEYATTLTYSLFSTLLCWTIQSLRQNVSFMQEEWRSLDNEHISSRPWNIPTIGNDLGPQNPRTFPKFADFTASRFLIALRNAIAHGDDRRVFPANIGGRLVGYTFKCIEDDREKKIEPFSEDISLTVADMARIGKELARRHGRGIQRKIGYSMSEGLPALREPRPPHMLRRNLNRG